MNVTELTPADILSRTDGGAYVVRKIWHRPKVVEHKTYPEYEIIGFTLLDTVTLTDREVTVTELQDKVNDNTLIPYQPITARIVPGITPKKYHDSPLKRHRQAVK